MINATDIIKNFSGNCAIWAAAGEDGDLAQIAQYAIEKQINYISCTPDSVARFWPWLEGANTQIVARFYMSATPRSYVGDLSDLCTRIRAAFKDGADGAQVFVGVSDLARFVNEMAVVRDDLFFNKTLSIGLDISDIAPSDWEMVLDSLNKIRATSVVFVITKYDEKKSDYVGRIYGALNVWNSPDIAMHVALGGNIVPMNQTLRLINKIRPELADKSIYWVRW